MLSPQEFFDASLAHIRLQGKPSMRYEGIGLDEDNKCSYLSPTGNKCGIGCFIPDGKYLPEFDSADGGFPPQC